MWAWPNCYSHEHGHIQPTDRSLYKYIESTGECPLPETGGPCLPKFPSLKAFLSSEGTAVAQPTRCSVEYYTPHADGARLHFTGLHVSYRFYNDKVLPVTNMLAEYGRGSISLQIQKPINLKLSASFEFGTRKNLTLIPF